MRAYSSKLLQKSNEDRLDACEELHRKAEKGELIIVTSALTITEVNKLPESPALLEEQSRTILDFFENPYIAFRPVDRGVAEYAHELTRTHGLTNIDAIHIATAILTPKMSVFYTYDRAKKRRKGLLTHNLKIGDPPLRIEIPPDPDEGSLFSARHRKSKPGANGLKNED